MAVPNTSYTPNPLDRLDLRRQDFNETFRPQREWIDGRGILIVIAHFLSGIAGGTWLFSLLFDFAAGLVMAIGCLLLSSAAHLAFLGRWERFWRILSRPQSSWISRGMWGLVLFLTGSIGYLLAVPTNPTLATLCIAISLLGMAATMICEGLVYAVSKAIPFWHTVFLPLLFITYGLRGGVALLLIVSTIGSNGFDIDAMEAAKVWIMVSTMLLILIYLIAANRSGGASTYAVHELIAGRISLAFHGGTIGVGIVVPVILVAVREFGLTGMLTLGAIALASLIGDFYVKYCIVKAGTYVPLGGPLARAN